MKNSVSRATAYEVLAPEYYDPVRHPTCANFRLASQQLIRPWLEKHSDGRAICEIGAGMSVVADLLLEMQLPLGNLYLTDSAQSMLKHSEKWAVGGASSIVAEASALPFATSAFGLCVSSLGDPYNVSSFWSELARVISANGYAIFTTPSYEWASRYRSNGSGDANGAVAEFILSDGRTIHVPSLIYSRPDQVAMIARGHLMEVMDFREITFSQLPAASISPKLLVTRELDLPIMAGYLMRRT
jgi:methyltransferase family protein